MKTIQEAKDLLESKGYFVDNLWHTDDVCMDFDCDQDTAMEIIGAVLTSDFIMCHTNEMIQETAEYDYELPKKEEQ